MPARAAANFKLRRQGVGHGRQALMEVGLAEEFQRGEAGDHRHGISRQRAGLVHGAQWGELLHDVAAAAECADRHAAADDLAQGGEIRTHAIQGLRPAQMHAKAGHDLVENQQRAAAIALASQGLQKIRRREHAVHVARHRLDDDAGHFRADLLEYLAAPGRCRCN